MGLADEASSRRVRAPGRWLVSRLVQGIAVLFAVTVLVFALTEALPGDPARTILGKDATPQAVAAVRHELGLDKPLVTQYVDWLSSVAKGSFGVSFITTISGERRSVTSLLLPRLANSLTLLVIAAVISIPLAVGLGVISALRQDGIVDRALLGGSLLLTAVPEFVIGLLLVVLLSTSVWKILPSVAIIPTGSTAIAQPKELVLPVLTLVVVVTSYPYRLARAGMIEALRSEYVTMARLKGVSARRVITRHALPNAIIPVVQASGICMIYLLSGIVVVEFVFGFPGLGTLLTGSVEARDLRTVQACALIYAAGVVLINIVVDAVTVLVTPRVRTAEFG